MRELERRRRRRVGGENGREEGERRQKITRLILPPPLSLPYNYVFESRDGGFSFHDNNCQLT